MAQKGTIFVEKTGEVFFGVNVFGEEDKDVIYQPVYKVKGLAGQFMKSQPMKMLSHRTAHFVITRAMW